MKLSPGQIRWMRAQERWALDPRAKAQGGFFYVLLIYVILFILSELLRPKPNLEDAKPAGLGDFQFPTATEERVVPLIWGTMQVTGPNVVWYGDIHQERITKRVKTNLWSSESIVVGYKYLVGVQFAFCRGPVDKLLRIWVGETVVFDGDITHLQTLDIDDETFFGGNENGNGGIGGSLRFFEGNQTQQPSSYLDDFQLEGGKTPAYRGTCYLTSVDEPFYVGNSANIKPWKFELQRIPDGLALGAGVADINGGLDANPANVLYEIFTNKEWGLGYDPSVINTSTAAGSRGFVEAGIILAAEGNGFSYILDRNMQASQLKDLVEHQIGGKVYFNRVTSMWDLALARSDYDINTVMELNDSNILEVKEFTRGSWDDTTNIVRAQFNNRLNEYQGTFGLAQDSANIRNQGGINVVTTSNFPGVKDPVLANQLAWRVLRTLSYPLAKATIIVDRSFFNTHPVDVFAFTSTQFDLQKLPMRVIRVDIGDLSNSKITLNLVQDVFFFQAGSFGDPGPTSWVPPSDTLLPFAVDEQIAFEAPRAFVSRNQDVTGMPALFWCGGRRIGNELGFRIYQRNSSGLPSGTFAQEPEEYYSLFLIGELLSNLGQSQVTPTATITIANSPDSQTAILDKIEESLVSDGALFPTQVLQSDSIIGAGLINIIYVWDGTARPGEFMIVRSAVANGGSNIDLQNVWRGVLDTAQKSFSTTDKVFLIFAGGGGGGPIPETNTLHVKMLPFSTTDAVLITAATQIVVEMDRRRRRPYCPSQVTLEVTDWASTIGLEADGSGSDALHFGMSFIRRDYRVGDGGDEILGLTIDAETLDMSFPAANNTTHNIEIRNDPDGINTLLYTDTGVTVDNQDQVRTRILHAAGGVLPTRMRCIITAVHDEGADVGLESYDDLQHDFDVTSTLTGQFLFGDLDTNIVSDVYTATDAGTYNFTIGTAFSSGDVEYRVNGGGWLTLIASTTTPGSIAGILVSDTIEVRHTSAVASSLTHLQMTAPGSGQDGWGILYV